MDNINKIDILQNMIDSSEYIVFLGGAGVSTESNIPDFRSANGLYKQEYEYHRETILSDTFFYEHTDLFYEFYKNKMLFPNAKPNKAHIALAKLEKKGKLKAVITQNIDNLHQAAGSKKVLELHGSVYRNKCINCSKEYDINYVLQSENIPKCTCGGLIKPDIVLYGEALDQNVLDESREYIRKADMLIIGGTSLTVYPAAGLINCYNADKLVLLNKSTTVYDHRANLVIHDSISDILSAIKI